MWKVSAQILDGLCKKYKDDASCKSLKIIMSLLKKPIVTEQDYAIYKKITGAKY